MYYRGGVVGRGGHQRQQLKVHRAGNFGRPTGIWQAESQEGASHNTVGNTSGTIAVAVVVAALVPDFYLTLQRGRFFVGG